MADQGPAESTAIMLEAVGYKVFIPNEDLRNELRRIGCDLVLSPKDLTRSMGYDPLNLPEIGIKGMDTCDLFVDVKAHRSYSRLIQRWPRLEKRILWGRINGAKPEHVIRRNSRGEVTEDCGDEINPPCPILTPNLWYRENPLAYACWPPFHRFHEYSRDLNPTDPPVCLIHNAHGWGYGKLFDPFQRLGVKIYGAGSPDGLIQHKDIPRLLARARCMIHLKSSDAPGYALYEALASGCPVVCTRRLIWRCRMEDLFIPGETCLVFDRETHEGLTEEDVKNCTQEVSWDLEQLSDPEENRRIGEAGRKRLQEVMWSKERDAESLRVFMERHFP